MFLHDGLDGLDHDDGVVHHDANREDHRQERDRVGGVAQCQHGGKGADQADRHGEYRDQRGAERAEEEEHDRDHQDEGLDQGALHHLDRRVHELGRVVGDGVGHAGGEARGQPPHRVLHVARDAERVGAGREVDGDELRRPLVEPGLDVLGEGAELGARHVAHAQHAAVRVGADGDGGELLGGAPAGPGCGC